MPCEPAQAVIIDARHVYTPDANRHNAAIELEPDAAALAGAPEGRLRLSLAGQDPSPGEEVSNGGSVDRQLGEGVDPAAVVRTDEHPRAPDQLDADSGQHPESS
jgi:hypothetical protein